MGLFISATQNGQTIRADFIEFDRFERRPLAGRFGLEFWRSRDTLEYILVICASVFLNGGLAALLAAPFGWLRDWLNPRRTEK